MKAVEKAITDTDAAWDNVDSTNLTRYVAMTVPREDIERLELTEIFPEPKGTTTFRSFLDPKGTARDTHGDSQFKPGNLRNPTNKEKKILIGMMVARTVEVCMSNHMYTIGGDIRIQGDGGSIGSDLTGEVTRIYMIQWEEELKKRCKKAGVSLDLYKRYVDDMFLAMRPIAR